MDSDITAEVMNEDEVYADFDGNAAGRVRPDAQGGPTAQGACAPCDAGENTLPPAQEFGEQGQKWEQRTEEHDRPVYVEAGQNQKQSERDEPEPACQATDSTGEAKEIRPR